MNTYLQNLLEYDAVDVAERATGNTGRVPGLSLLLHMQNSEKLNAELKAQKDVNTYEQNWNEVHEIVDELGFKMIHSHKVNHPDYDYDDGFNVLWKEDEGLLLVMESYNTSRVNKIHLYGCFKGDVSALIGCSREVFDADNCCTFDKDVRQGFKFFLNTARSKGKFLPQWNGQSRIWLVDYSQENEIGYNYDGSYERVINDVLNSLPLEVQKAVCHIRS